MDNNDHAHQTPLEGEEFVDPTSGGDTNKPANPEKVADASPLSDAAPSVSPAPSAPDSEPGPLLVSGLAHALRELQEGLRAQVGVETLQLLEDSDLVAAVIGVERICCQLDALKVGLANQIGERSRERAPNESIAYTHGCESGVDLIQRATLCTRAEARRRIRLGEHTSSQVSLSGAPIEAERPYVGLALRSAVIPVDTARKIVGTLSRVPKGEAQKLDYAERALVEAATGIDFQTGTLKDIQQRLKENPEPLILQNHDEAGLLDPLPEPQDVVPQTQPQLAQHADTITTLCKTWSQYLDQDGTPPTDKQILASRSLNIGTEKDGVIPITGKLTPEVAATLTNLLDAINAPRNNNHNNGRNGRGDTKDNAGKDAGNNTNDDTGDHTGNHSGDQCHASGTHNDSANDGNANAGSDGVGSDSCEAGRSNSLLENLWEQINSTVSWVGDIDGRTPNQKRHDGLAAILGVAATSNEIPSHGGSPVTVLVQTSEEALTNNGAAWLHGPSHQTTLLTPQAARHATCSGALQYYAQNRAGKIVALGSKQRVFTTNQRRAIVARDGGCVIPGCDTPPAWLEIHHVHPHAKGGKTHVDNGVALCWYHHRTIETNGWEIRMKNGTPQIRAPYWLDPNQNWLPTTPPTKPPNPKPPNPKPPNPKKVEPKTTDPKTAQPPNPPKPENNQPPNTS